MADELVDALCHTLDAYVSFVLCLVGVVINLVAIVTLFRQRLTAIFHKLMLSLVIYDLLYVSFYLLVFVLPLIFAWYKVYLSSYLIPFLMPATQMALAGSCFSTTALTTERYISVCRPFFKQRHNIKARLFIVPVFVFIVIYGSPRFLETSTVHKTLERCRLVNATDPLIGNATDLLGDFGNASVVDSDAGSASNVSDVLAAALDANLSLVEDSQLELYNESETLEMDSEKRGFVVVRQCFNFTLPDVAINPIRTNKYYVSIYANWMNIIFNLLLPFCVMVSLNICIYRSMRSFCPEVKSEGGMRRLGLNERELRKRDSKYTRASVVMVCAFVVCNGPRLVPNCMELFLQHGHFPKWALVLVSVNHLLTVLNSSFNFLIYLSFCRRKRKASRPSRLSPTTCEQPSGSRSALATLNNEEHNGSQTFHLRALAKTDTHNKQSHQ